jgi:AcrR family transcriptional regulator
LTNTAPTQAVPEESDARVLKAAGRLFREKGFSASTVREIAAAAGMLPGSLHYRYASKEEILIALMEKGIDRAIDAVRKAVAAVRDPIERLRLGLRAHLVLLLSGEDALYVLLFDWRSLPANAQEGVARQRSKYEAFWDGLLFEAAGTGRARPLLDIEMVRQFGIGAINWVATWYRADQGRTPEQIADAFWTFMAYGLIADHARPPDVAPLFEALLPQQEKEPT